MLKKYDKRLAELREKMLRRGAVEEMISQLKRQRPEIALREKALRQELEREQADVDRLNEGFRSIYYTILGKKEAMLENEQAEVQAVSVRYEAVRQELKSIDDQIEQLSWNLRDITNAETKYRETLDEKLAAMREAGIEADKILPIEEQIYSLKEELKKIKEAQTAGRCLAGYFESIERELRESESYIRHDSALALLARHACIENAQNTAQKLEQYIREFQTRLASVTEHTAVRVEMSGYTRISDLLTDGIFIDWSVIQRVQGSMWSAGKARDLVQGVVRQLEKAMGEIEEQISHMQNELRAIAENAK